MLKWFFVEDEDVNLWMTHLVQTTNETQLLV